MTSREKLENHFGSYRRKKEEFLKKKKFLLKKFKKKFPKKFFSKLQKRSKMLEKMILSPMEVVSEGGNREKVAKKEKLKKILRFQRP